MNVITLSLAGVALVLLVIAVVAVVLVRKARGELRISDGRFLLAFSGLLASVAAANGEVVAAEIAKVEEFLRKMGLSPAEKALCYGNFMLMSRVRRDVHAFAREIAGEFGRAGRSLIYSLVWRVAMADGSIDPSENDLLREIADDLGFGADVYAWFKANELPVLNFDELRREGVPASLLHLARKRRD